MSAAQTMRQGSAFTLPPPALEVASIASAPAFDAPAAELNLAAKLLAGDPRTMRLYEIVTTKEPAAVDAWLRAGEAIAAGMDPAEAETRMKAEIAAGPGDAALLTACTEHTRLAAEEARLLGIMRSFDVHDDSEEANRAGDAWDAANDATHVVLERVVEAPATTPLGVAAKGRAVLTYLRTLDSPGETDATRNYTDIAARSVLADLERMAAKADAISPPLIGKVEALCQPLRALWADPSDAGSASACATEIAAMLTPPETVRDALMVLGLGASYASMATDCDMSDEGTHANFLSYARASSRAVSFLATCLGHDLHGFPNLPGSGREEEAAA